MHARVLAVVTVMAALATGCRPSLLLSSGMTVVQHYQKPDRFLLIVHDRNFRDSLWHSQYCETDTMHTRIHQLSVGDSIVVLQEFTLSPDSEFVAQEQDTLYHIFRLNAWLGEDQQDRECFYVVVPIADKPNRRVYHTTRYVDFYVLGGIISKVKVYIWMT